MVRQTGSKAAIRSGVKYRSTIARNAVCSGGSMPLGTETRWETTLLKVSGSSRSRMTSSWRRIAQLPSGVRATGQRVRNSS
jgi:hypothetical protein